LVSMAGLFEGRAQIGVIEDLAVIYNLECAVFVGHGLVASGDIYDAEAAVAQGGEMVAIIAGSVGPAMTNGVRHAHELRIRRGAGATRYESCDTTHKSDRAICISPK